MKKSKIDWEKFSRDVEQDSKDEEFICARRKFELAAQIIIALPGLWFYSQDVLFEMVRNYRLSWSEKHNKWIPDGSQESTLSK